jgi:hypothetical protein
MGFCKDHAIHSELPTITRGYGMAAIPYGGEPNFLPTSINLIICPDCDKVIDKKSLDDWRETRELLEAKGVFSITKRP